MTHTITIEASAFEPVALTVHAGDIVTWVNKDFFPHTATASDGRFDSGSLAPGMSWSFTVTAVGTVSYSCTLHPAMKGTIDVK